MPDCKSPLIGSLVAEQITAKRKVYPCRAVRASSIGYFDEAEGGCLRRGVYSQTHWKKQKLPDPGLQEVFEEGNMQEAACRPLLMDWLQNKKLKLYSGPPRTRDEGGMSGQPDGYIEPIDGAYDFEMAIEEFKSIIDYRWQSLPPEGMLVGEVLDAFRKSPYMTAWLGQCQAYMLLYDIPLCCMILKTKQKMAFKSYWMELDYEWAERLLKVRDSVINHIKAGTLPDKVNSEACTSCWHSHHCMPDLIGSGNFELVTNVELSDCLDELGELDEARKKINSLETLKKKLLPKGVSGICGNWLIGGKMVDKKSYKVDATEYWRSKVTKLDVPESQSAVAEKREIA